MSAYSRSQWIAVPFIVLGMLSLLIFGAVAPQTLTDRAITLTGNAFVDGKLTYQIVTLAIALAVLAVTYVVARGNARRFYRLGQLDAPADAVRWLGIGAGERWSAVGRNFAIIISAATGAFVFFTVTSGHSMDSGNARYLPFVLVLAAMNAFTEEAISRLALVTALHGLLPKAAIALASALLFGIPHYAGIPGGPLGALMAGFLGWLLARSIIETRGMFWAWLIHFLQDVIIFAALFLVAL